MNTAADEGGGIFQFGGVSNLKKNRIENNIAMNRGGGMLLSAGLFNNLKSSITGNTPDDFRDVRVF